MLEKKISYSIYLLKDEYVQSGIHLKDIAGCQHFDILVSGHANASVYLKVIPSKGHSWKALLPTETSNIDWIKFRTSCFYGLILLEVDKRLFALTSGLGRYLLHPFAVENRFGFKAVLNSVDPQTIHQLSKMSIELNPKRSIEQVTKGITLNQFGLDGFTDLVQRVKGRSKIENLGISLDGEDALKISVAHELHELPDLLSQCLNYYNSDEYKNHFPEVDNLSLVKGKEQIHLLNSDFDNRLKSELDKLIHNEDLSGDIWAAIPEILVDDDFDCYTYRNSDNALRYYDIELPDIFREKYVAKNKLAKKELNLSSLKSDCIYVKKSDGSVQPKWNAIHCINAIIEYKSEKFFFNDCQWYRVNSNYIDSLDDKISKIPSSNLNFKDWPQNIYEEDYLRSNPLNHPFGYVVLDQNNIYIKGQKPIEPCDIYTEDKLLIHLKRYGSSAVLGHLFNQGYVSGDLLLNSVDFKNKFNEKLDCNYRILNVNPSEFTISYVISSKHPNAINLPLFSKITLTKAYDELKKKGFKVTLDVILTTS